MMDSLRPAILLRNRVNHEIGFKLVRKAFYECVEGYRRALVEMGVLIPVDWFDDSGDMSAAI